MHGSHEGGTHATNAALEDKIRQLVGLIDTLRGDVRVERVEGVPAFVFRTGQAYFRGVAFEEGTIAFDVATTSRRASTTSSFAMRRIRTFSSGIAPSSTRSS